MNFVEEENRIYAKDESGKLIAEITFKEIENGLFNIDHTFVDESLRGKGVASLLVEKTVNLIKGKNAKVTATCSYAKTWIEKHSIK